MANAGPSYEKAKAAAQESANSDGQPRYLHNYNGSWWIERQPVNGSLGMESEKIEPMKGSNHSTPSLESRIARSMNFSAGEMFYVEDQEVSRGVEAAKAKLREAGQALANVSSLARRKGEDEGVTGGIIAALEYAQMASKRLSDISM